jgi:DNA-directed RNA polymerase sigma subunit (sigma70/sigma32)
MRLTNVLQFRPRRPLDLKAALDELDDDQRNVIRARWGLDGEPLQDDEIAEKFDLDIEWVWEMQDKGLQMLGYLWLTETLLPYAAALEAAA